MTEYIEWEGGTYRVLCSNDDRLLVIRCGNRKPLTPKWVDAGAGIKEAEPFIRANDGEMEKSLSAKEKAQAIQRFAVIDGILPYIGDKQKRNVQIQASAVYFSISRDTVMRYLYIYLSTGSKYALADRKKQTDKGKELTPDQKNMRYSLNKWYYTGAQAPLTFAYRQMIAKFYTGNGTGVSGDAPSFHAFYRFYRANRNMMNQYISRNGKGDYMRNRRPLVGGSVSERIAHAGCAMIDTMECDIYLSDDGGNLISERPMMLLAVDAYSRMIMGYSMHMYGSGSNIGALFANVIADKVNVCASLGITINRDEWDSHRLPMFVVTDRGSDYLLANSKIAMSNLGITTISLEAFRPDMKSIVERRFGQIMTDRLRPYLMTYGYIDKDAAKRGAPDYRKGACLTLREFEEIVVRTIIYYNTKHVIEDFPLTEDMLSAGIPPRAADIWRYSVHIKQDATFALEVSAEELRIIMLPRSAARFTRRGLRFNGMYYFREGYTDRYLCGGTAEIAYDPYDASSVWLITKDMAFEEFRVTDGRFVGKTHEEALEMKSAQALSAKKYEREQLEAEINLGREIEAIRDRAKLLRSRSRDKRGEGGKQ